ncbi:uncharacterized protein LOC122388182 [Amphibalanus amphitrite]|uniref:uncharacterized protein LOC122388182 n=1 Tax=Amphibalanus amphitrite TaxID=1232801 RepID=UPI001C923CE4|nr:uncharacterized protein LOC122388182 [Amphibalanus amphitrite]
MDHRPPRRHFRSGRIRVCRGSRVLQVKSPSTSVDAEVTAATADPGEGTSASGPPAMDIEESWLVIDDAVDHLLHRAGEHGAVLQPSPVPMAASSSWHALRGE